MSATSFGEAASLKKSWQLAMTDNVDLGDYHDFAQVFSHRFPRLLFRMCPQILVPDQFATVGCWEFL